MEKTSDKVCRYSDTSKADESELNMGHVCNKQKLSLKNRIKLLYRKLGTNNLFFARFIKCCKVNINWLRYYFFTFSENVLDQKKRLIVVGPLHSLLFHFFSRVKGVHRGIIFFQNNIIIIH